MTSGCKVRARRLDGMLHASSSTPFIDLLKPEPKKRAKKEMPLLLKSCPGTYRQVLDLLYVLDFDEKANRPKVLPPELASRVLRYLTVEPVSSFAARAMCCSTHDGVHPLSESLSESETTWWLAQQGSMPSGKGRQYVQYSLSPTLCRIKRVSIRIPPLPLGPLSVREFTLETFCVERGWFRISPNYLVQNREGWQTFDLPDGGCDVDEIRVVCLRNQMAEYLEDLDMSTVRNRGLLDDIQRFASVGFFSVRFE